MTRWIFVLALLLSAPSFTPIAQATVPTSEPRNDYTGNGSTATYSYTFKIFAAEDLRVTTRDTANEETTLVYPTNYTVTGVGKAAGGTITLVAGNLTSGHRLTIRFDRTPRQSTDLRNQGSYFPETHETKFDELTRYAQQNRDVLKRSLHLPETEAGTDAATTLPVAADRASKFLGFDASGNPLAAAGTSANLGPVSSFINTLLDDVDAATARTTLGVTNTSTLDSDFRIKGSADATKQLAFEVDGITTGTTRTVTMPDKSGTLAMTSDLASAASDTTAGIVELATQAEVNAMTDTSRVLTPNHNKIVMGGSIATTSGTTRDVTGVPAGVRRITGHLVGVSLSGTNDILLRIGDSGGLESASYNGVQWQGTSGVAVTNLSSSFILMGSPGAAAALHGTFTLELADVSTNTWTISSSFGTSGAVTFCQGSKSLSAELDRFSLISSGANTFDAGTLYYTWER